MAETSSGSTSDSEVERLIGATQYLLEDSATRKPLAKLKEAVKVIQDVAKESGLEPDCIKVLMDYVTGKGGGMLVTRIQVLRCLVPRTTVPVVVLFCALGSMRKQPLPLQLVLFRWMVLVIDLVDQRDHLQAMYDVIFQYLGYDELRAPVCQLLCYMTTRSHVKEFRVQRLLELHKQVVINKEASESSLMALLAIYKLHSPHLVPVGNPRGKKDWFKSFEKVLASNIEKVQRKRSEPANKISSHSRFHRCLSTMPPPRKKQKRMSSIPAPLPSHSQKSTDQVTVPIATLSSVHELCDCVDRLELPGQMGSVLGSPLLQHIFSIWPDPSAAHRLTYWLQAALGAELDEYKPGYPESPGLLSMLSGIVELTGFLMEPLPTVEVFLLIFLECWNGEDYKTQVFKLLSYTSLQDFDDLDSHYLEPLQRLFVAKGLQFKSRTLECLTDLLQFWGVLEWPRYRRRMEAGTGSPVGLRLSIIPGSSWNSEEVPGFDAIASIKLLVRHIECLLRIALFQEQGHTHIRHAAATFYEVVTRLPLDCEVPLLLVPHPQIVNQTLLALEPTALSRILTCYNRCKLSLSSIDKSRRDLATIKSFNSVVLDLCKSLWKDQAFSSDSRPYPTHLFTFSRKDLESCGFSSVSNKLNISNHPALMGFVKRFFEETQGSSHHKFRPNAVWTKNQSTQSYLEYLHHRLLEGIPNFIQTFIRK